MKENTKEPEEAGVKIEEIVKKLRLELKYDSPEFQAFAFKLKEFELISRIASVSEDYSSNVHASEERIPEAELGALRTMMLGRRTTDMNYLQAEAYIDRSFDEMLDLAPYFLLESTKYKMEEKLQFVFLKLNPVYNEIINHASTTPIKK